MRKKLLRLAVWSGPRNISTALMRSWGNRADTIVVDEPLYAHYLSQTGIDHPGADEVMADQENDWRKVVAVLVGPLPEGKTIFYQKHMAHHLLPNIDRDWLTHLTHVFLIRDPREMLTSLVKNLPNASLSDTGLSQQVEIFESERRRQGTIPPVIDSKDILDDPRGVLTRLCETLDVPFDEAMLSWPPGPRATDGIWAKYWYHNVEQSTSFRPYQAKPERVPPHLEGLLEQCLAHYQTLYQHRLTSRRTRPSE